MKIFDDPQQRAEQQIASAPTLGGASILRTIPMGGSNPTVLSWPFAQGLPFYGGITWQASVANTVKRHLWGTN